MFDVYYGLSQIKEYKLTVFLWAWIWLWFGTFIINKIALAMVEDGYLAKKNNLKYDWLTR